MTPLGATMQEAVLKCYRGGRIAAGGGLFAGGPFAAGLIAGGLFASGLNAAARTQPVNNLFLGKRILSNIQSTLFLHQSEVVPSSYFTFLIS